MVRGNYSCSLRESRCFGVGLIGCIYNGGVPASRGTTSNHLRSNHQPNRRFVDSLGYYISTRSFKGPFLPVADVRAKKVLALSGINLYCVKKELRDAVTAASSGRRGLLSSGSSRRQAEAAWSTWLTRAAGQIP